MIAKHFRSNFSILTTLFWVVLIFILNSQLSASDPSVLNTSISGQLINFLMASEIGEISSLFVFISLIAFSSYLFNNSYIIDQYRSFLPMFLAVIMLGAGNFMLALDSAHIGLLFILLTLLSLLNITNAAKPQNNITNASLLLSTGSLLVPHLLYFIPIIWITAIIFKHLNIRAFFASLVGIFTPYLIASSIYYLNDTFDSQLILFTDQFTAFNYSIPNINQGFLVFLAFIGVIFLITLASLQKKTDRLKTYSRNVIAVILVFLLLSIAYFSFGLINLKSVFIYCSFPLSILFSIHLNNVRPKISNASIILLLIASLIGFIAEF